MLSPAAGSARLTPDGTAVVTGPTYRITDQVDLKTGLFSPEADYGIISIILGCMIRTSVAGASTPHPRWTAAIDCGGFGDITFTFDAFSSGILSIPARSIMLTPQLAGGAAGSRILDFSWKASYAKAPVGPRPFTFTRDRLVNILSGAASNITEIPPLARTITVCSDNLAIALTSIVLNFYASDGTTLLWRESASNRRIVIPGNAFNYSISNASAAAGNFTSIFELWI